MPPMNLSQFANQLQGGNTNTASLIGMILQQGLGQQQRPTGPFGPMQQTLAGLQNYFPSMMGGVNQQIGDIMQRNAAGATRANDRELEWAIEQLRNQTSNRGIDAQENVGMANAIYRPQGDIQVAGLAAQGGQNAALANALGQVGSSQYNAMGNYLAGVPQAQAAMNVAPINAQAQQNVAGIQGLAEVLQSAIPANLQYALAPAQMGSNERIAGMQSMGDLFNALSSQYGARQGAQASMFGSQAGADAAMHGANQNALADIFGSRMGLQGIQDTNSAGRYAADQQLAGTALGHQTGLMGVQDTNRTQQNIAQNTNQTNYGIAGLQAGAQKYGTQGDVLQGRMGLEGARSAADANRYGSQQNALASMFGSGAGLQSNREQEAGRNQRFDKSLGTLSSLLGRFSTLPQFGGFRTNYGTGASFG
jgi:hypothetical protein